MIQVIVMYMTFCKNIPRSEHDYNKCCLSSRNDPPQILRMLFLLPVLLVASLASADQMPAQWLGKYKLKVMMIIFLMQASTSLRPARASPPSCPRLG